MNAADFRSSDDSYSKNRETMSVATKSEPAQNANRRSSTMPLPMSAAAIKSAAAFTMTVGHASPNLLSGVERKSNRKAATTHAEDRLCGSSDPALAIERDATPIVAAKLEGISQYRWFQTMLPDHRQAQ